MKVTKLIVGILQMVLAAFIVFQSCAVGASHAMENKTSDAGGSAGIIVALLFLACGITYVATRNAKGLGGDIAGLVMMLISWIVAITNGHDYTDLVIWGWTAFIIGVGFFVWHLVLNKKSSGK
ncbi:hypothetical protein F5ESL0233_05960 [Lactobacillus sp. ESL0233]|uniref:hypothetical protein n=1 Tax=Lactobacillus sp. ESL0233 TaxID=2069354 RepID=UPI000EFB5573|nr:hypothetical protein [Lactobacillus sp. ESL0233]RMC41849.1 hypothetical protein F5ESL0233_05960 [Lactobacillus sp. ESL0233]